VATTVPPTDSELDAFIKTRLALIGIDLAQLPLADATAPADQTRVLSSLRGFLRGTVPAISNYLADVQENPPAEYPAQLTAWNEADSDWDRKR
jgi:hypothetical protein